MSLREPSLLLPRRRLRLPKASVYTKLVLCFVVIGVAVATFATVAMRVYDQTVDRAARNAAQQVAAGIAFAIVDRGELVEDLQDYLERLYTDRARDVTVVDPTGRDIADSDPHEVGKPYRADTGEVAATLADGVTRTFVESAGSHRADGKYLQIVTPVRRAGAGSPIIAALVLEYTPIRDDLVSAESDTFLEMLVLGFLVVLGVTVFGLGMARHITRPIRALHQGVKRVHERDYGARVSLKTRDEFGSLGRAFNAMARDLEAHQNELEAKVNERTSQLNALNVLLQEQVEQRSWEAMHDPLTGLPNRREFDELVVRARESAREGDRRHVVACLDLDRFKVVNDTCGHGAGDELLKEISALLRARIRKSDTLARLGGDEFGLLLDGCPIAQAERIAADVLAAVESYRFHWEGKVFTVGVSIGLCEIAADLVGDDPLGMADAACYWAKEQGRHRACVYRSGDADLTERRQEAGWIARLTQALEEDRFVLYHQTYLHLAGDDAREHLEVLLRMVGEDGALIQPGSFIPAAERYNLMPAIDRWVIQRVFAAYHDLVRGRGRPVTCAINLSGTSMNADGFLAFVRSQAAEHRMPAGSICFEITETVAINNLRHATDFVRACKELGFLFALDDFGTGTSSFGYLKNLPVDYLKIDGGFVRNMNVDQVDRAMTETIHRIGRIMGIQTVAEFAENEAIIEELRRMGVDFAQGYGVQVPAPLLTEMSLAA